MFYQDYVVNQYGIEVVCEPRSDGRSRSVPVSFNLPSLEPSLQASFEYQKV